MSRARVLIRRVRVLVPLIAALSLAVPATGAQAAPTPSLDQAQKKVDSLVQKMQIASEQYNTAKVDLTTSKARQAKLHKSIEALQPRVDVLADQTASYAVNAYQGSDMSLMTSLLNSGSPQTFLDQLSTVQSLTGASQAQLDKLLTAQKALAAAKERNTAEIVEQAQQEKILRTRKVALQKDLDVWRELRSRLSPLVDTSGPYPVYTGDVASRAGKVVKFAYDALGSPYVFGAAGPGSYDCSGLTLSAYGQVGVSLPHSARRQFAQGPQVPRSDLMPGDLVYFYSDLHHVGIYIGNNKVIHAPQPGESVKISDLSVFPFAGASRPGS
ncbi:MAG TPA: NlpC/P60 family protein [Mycobacteriales bacterium]|nr:NlpC/P60 family protein [Mycobacteriales bacterium]